MSGADYLADVIRKDLAAEFRILVERFDTGLISIGSSIWLISGSQVSSIRGFVFKNERIFVS